LPDGATFDAATRTFIWTPDYNQAGDYQVQFEVSDNSLTTVEQIIITVIHVNRPPVANAGPDQLNIEATSTQGAEVTLNGTGSSDPDLDALTYTWKEGSTIIATRATPTVQLALGSHNLTLIVNDGQVDSQADSVNIKVLDTTPPVLKVPEDLVVTATGEFTPVTLTAATAIDLIDGPVEVTNNAPASFAIGTTPVTYIAKDSKGNTTTKTVNVTIEDKVAPVVTITGLTDHHDYTGSVTPQIQITDGESGIKTQSIKLDGNNYIPGTAISTTSSHTLVVTATDYAGNVTTVSINFSIYNSSRLEVATTQCAYSDIAIMTATLISEGSSVSGKTLFFKLNGVDIGTAITDCWML
jgi:hypothetical protein